jgi:glycosyltransferase involved in cell wall biosynthesis
MRIGVDFTSAVRERAGIGRYARELVRALARLDRSNRYVLFVPRDAQADLLAWDWPGNFTVVRAPLSERLLAALWHRARVPLPIEALIGSTDVFYSPDFLLPPTRARRTLVTIHDLSYVRLPECFPDVLRRYLDDAVPRAVRRADLILADAASTRRDLIEVYGVPSDKVLVLYSGVDARFHPDIPESERARVRSRYCLREPYLLSVSTIQPRKNYVRLLEAWAKLISKSEFRNSNYRLVLAGRNGWMYDQVYRTVKRLDLNDRVLFPGFVSDTDLPALYSMATLFVYPSLYEGFGLPVAEAMACGVPVVLSNVSSLPEVAGEAGLYFDPCDVDAMTDAIYRALSDPTLRAGLRAQGLSQAEKFSWDRAAEELLTCLGGGL